MPPRFYDTVLSKYLQAEINARDGREKPIEMRNDGSGLLERSNGPEYSIMSPVGPNTSLRLGDNDLGITWEPQKLSGLSASVVRHRQSQS